jgi:hypothetical protein
MTEAEIRDQRKFEKLITSLSIRDLDLDAFADGILAHRDGHGFHENPEGAVAKVRRLSWSLGWNERALQHPD